MFTLRQIKYQIWHKICFKCQVCSMTLNMRNYKGYNKDPYCEAHIPKAKATTVAETPELKRIAENTKIQSNVKYHAEFEKAKGKLTQVADDPETLRMKQNSKIISNVAYHGDLQKKAEMEQRRNMTGQNGESSDHGGGTEKQSKQLANNSETKCQSNPGKISDYNPLGSDMMKNSPYSARQSSTVIYTSQDGPVRKVTSQRIGSIADWDPVAVNYSPPPSQNQNYRNNPPPTSYMSSGRVFKAMYDYEAQDTDEVSFLNGDLIINCSPIDGGWMNGTVKRTGLRGMLPANYVEPVTI
ncbi:LIM and SH3 domain protein F42H10.3 isoform X2 [Bemisia tabaci]|uniref:LIM and SH3 domain protein F42H10.3 isoform X2 n=1 Tax=Bemisia tabaci TaxID=7038 RepID=UPI003B284602